MSNEDKALAALEKVIAENEANGFPGIDRSEAGVKARHDLMNVAGGKDKGNSPFGRKLEEHVIKGDLTKEQASSVLMVFYGLG